MNKSIKEQLESYEEIVHVKENTRSFYCDPIERRYYLAKDVPNIPLEKEWITKEEALKSWPI